MMNRQAQAETERRFPGTVASPGFASGRLVALSTAARSEGAAAGTPDEERSRLDEAVAGAIAELAELMESIEDEEAEGIVAFQMAMLEDESFLEPVMEGIAAGQGAQAAWSHAMEAAIADYANADDAYFRARAADLSDIRERVADRLAGEARHAIPPASIVVAQDLSPTRFLATDWSDSGIALAAGSTAGHVAILARARGVPMLVGLGTLPQDGQAALLDAESGCLIVAPCAASREAFEACRAGAAEQAAADATYLHRPAAMADGTPVKVGVNLAGPEDVEGIDIATCDGSGLVRTEFLFEAAGGLLDEETQTQAYRRILAWAQGKTVTIRTLDAGGDKPIPGITVDGEANPFLGQRGIRLSLLRPKVFTVQLRALLRAAADGPLRIMLPMVTEAEEVEEARKLLDQARAALLAEGQAVGEPQLGIMVEVPAAALALETFDVDFVSIGTNDLTQYVTAAARDNGALGRLARPDNPGVLRLVEMVARHAAEQGMEAGVCGDMAGDPRYIPDLLARGVHSLSVAPAALARVKATVARCGG